MVPGQGTLSSSYNKVATDDNPYKSFYNTITAEGAVGRFTKIDMYPPGTIECT
jgi:hypothetical protein